MESRLLAIVGPTAVGKSDLALRLAGRHGGEIVGADSRQVYRHMDIGTAKPSVEDRLSVPHHLIDVADPDDDYSLAIFLKQAGDAIKGVQERSNLPILVGGSGQHVWGLLEGWQVPEVPPDPDLRSRLEKRARTEGGAALHEELFSLSPAVATRIDARNVRRVIRALERVYASSQPGPEPHRMVSPPYRTKIVGLTMPRSALYRRVDRRVDDMISAGWTGEVRALLDMGYSPLLPSLSGVGYRELVQHAGGEATLDATVERIKRSSHRLVRRQHSWFRPADRRIEWIDVSAGLHAAEEAVERWLSQLGSN